MAAAAATPNPTAPPPRPPPDEEDLRHLAAPMSELAAVQMEVAAAEGKCRRLQSLLRAGEREMAKLQATIDDARGAVSSGSKEGGGGGNRATKREALGAEDDDGGAAAASAAAEAARHAAAGIWREVEVLDARIAVVVHALGEVERVKGEGVGRGDGDKTV